ERGPDQRETGDDREDGDDHAAAQGSRKSDADTGPDDGHADERGEGDPPDRAGGVTADAAAERPPEQDTGQPDQPEDEQPGPEDEERRAEKRDEQATQHHRPGDRYSLARAAGALTAVGRHEREQDQIREHA